MPKLTEIASLIEKVKKRPETTLSLKQIIKRGEETVSTYYFTDSIRKFFEVIFDAVASKRGSGYWVQAEYGAGKTHFLATLSCLLIDTSEKLWKSVKDEEIRECRRRIVDKKIFPIILSLKGAASVDQEDDLLKTLLDELKEELTKHKLTDKVSITTDDELISWYRSRPPDIQSGVASLAKRFGKALDKLNSKEFAVIIKQYCVENFGTIPNISGTTKDRIKHIYSQLVQYGYQGILIIIDEFEAWQRMHEGSKESARDEEVLETLAWVLPRDAGLEIYTVVASQTVVPTKLRGERFSSINLLSNEHDYDVIVCQRVREIIAGMEPEIEQYFEYYRKEFKFLKDQTLDYFVKIFPFQPRCFEVARRITAKELPTARSGILIAYDCLSKQELLERNALISVSDLMSAEELVAALHDTNSYKMSYLAFEEGLKSLSDFPLDQEEKTIADQILKTLFLWHLAFIDTPRLMSVLELSEATLTSSDLIRGEDLIEVVLSKLKELPQISYSKEKGARFIPTGEVETKPSRIFSTFKKKITDEQIVIDTWNRSLLLQPQDAGGEESIFPGYKFDEKRNVFGEHEKVEYPGEVIVSRRWRAEYGEKLSGGTHFRVVLLTEHQEVNIEELKDIRTAICIPSPLTDAVKDAAKDYRALLDMEDHYRDKTGSEADDVRSWIFQSKRKEVIQELLRKQTFVYRNGKILTGNQLGFDEKKAFSLKRVDKILEIVVPTILSDAYANNPVDTKLFKKKFSSREAKNLFDGLFRKLTTPAASSACENYAPYLKFSSTNDPSKFAPHPNKVFDIIESDLQKGEMQIWRLFEKLQSCGLTKEMCNLYLLAFVRRGQPNVEISLRYGNKQNIPKITSFNIGEINWGTRLEDDFEILYPSAEIHWNDILPYAKIINSNLKTASSPEDIEEQEKQLIHSSSILKDQIPHIERNLDILSSKFNEIIPSGELAIVSQMQTIITAKDRLEFYSTLKTIYQNDQDFSKDIEIFNRLRKVTDSSTELITIKTYLDEIILPEEGKMFSDLVTLRGRLVLGSIISSPNVISSIKEQFEKFRNEYQNKYQIIHREYQKSLKLFQEKVNELAPRIQAIRSLDEILRIKSSLSDTLQTQKEKLSLKTKLCQVQDPVTLSHSPYCEGCKLLFGEILPEEELSSLSKEVERALKNSSIRLSQAFTKVILERDTSKKLDKLIKVIQLSDFVKLSEILTAELVAYIQDLFDEASIVTIPISIFGKIRERFVYVDEENIEELVKAFREEIENSLRLAKEKNPNKKVKINLQ